MALTGTQYGKSLVASLSRVADSVRKLNDTFGLRPYAVRLVTLQWSGFKVGNGLAVVTSEVDVSPTPNIPGLRFGVAFSDTVEEEHDLTVSEIPFKYTPEQLSGRGADGTVAPSTETFWEIEKFLLDGSPSSKRRYEVAVAPVWVPSELGWRIGLRRARGDRTRSGAP